MHECEESDLCEDDCLTKPPPAPDDSIQIVTYEMEDKRGLSWGTYARIGVCLACIFGHGMSFGILGPTLADLQEQTGTTTKTISTIFIWRNFGMFLGSFTSGHLTGKLDNYFLMGLGVLTVGLSLGIGILATHLATLSLVVFIAGFASGIVTVCAIGICASLVQNPGPVTQLSLCIPIVGAMLIAQVVKPFLRERVADIDDKSVNGSEMELTNIFNVPQDFAQVSALQNQNQSLPTNISNQILTTQGGFASDSNFHASFNVSTNISSVFPIDGISQDNESTIKYAFFIYGVYQVIVFIFAMTVVAIDGCHLLKTHRKKCQKEDKDQKKPQKENCDNKDIKQTIETEIEFRVPPKHLVRGISLAIFLLGIFTGCIEDVSGSLLATFVYHHLKWSKANASHITSAYWGSIALVRFVNIFVSKLVSPRIYIGIGTLGMIIFSTIMIICIEKAPWVPWLTVMLFGIAHSPIFPCSVSWCYDLLGVSGKNTAIFIFGLSFGKIFASAATGLLMEILSFMVYCYVLMVFACLTGLVYVFTCIMEWRKKLYENPENQASGKMSIFSLNMRRLRKVNVKKLKV